MSGYRFAYNIMALKFIRCSCICKWTLDEVGKQQRSPSLVQEKGLGTAEVLWNHKTQRTISRDSSGRKGEGRSGRERTERVRERSGERKGGWGRDFNSLCFSVDTIRIMNFFPGGSWSLEEGDKEERDWLRTRGRSWGRWERDKEQSTGKGRSSNSMKKGWVHWPIVNLGPAMVGLQLSWCQSIAFSWYFACRVPRVTVRKNRSPLTSKIWSSSCFTTYPSFRYIICD